MVRISGGRFDLGSDSKDIPPDFSDEAFLGGT